MQVFLNSVELTGNIGHSLQCGDLWQLYICFDPKFMYPKLKANNTRSINLYENKANSCNNKLYKVPDISDCKGSHGSNQNRQLKENCQDKHHHV